jgi:hypothetical protein
MMRDIEPDVLRYIADALAAIQKANDSTGYGYVEDHLDQAVSYLVLAAKHSLDSNNGVRVSEINQGEKE